MPDDILPLVLEAEKRWGTPPFVRELFAQQLAFIADAGRAKAALCSRRAGKTYAACAYLLLAAFRNPGTVSAYIALTRASAKRLLWEELIRFDHRHSLGLTFNHSELTARLPNGSSIFLVGADDAATIERLRGGKYLLAIVDEAASFRPSVLESLVREILRPALIDLRGTLCLIGTPGAACVGLFHDATTDPASPFKLHHWTVLENPHVPHAREELDHERKANHWTEDHPIYRREWLGEWVRDSGSLVYQYEPTRNGTGVLGGGPARQTILGCDYGVVDATAFAIWAWEPHQQTCVLLECWGQTGLIPSEAARIVRELNAKWHFDRIVGDVGGLGKGFAEEARQRFAVPIMPAQKTNKRGYIELFNGDLKSGLIRVVADKCKQWVEEATICQWDEKREKEDPRFDNHCLDAALYGWRECKAFAEDADPSLEPEPSEEERLRRQHMERWERRKEADEQGVDWFSRRFW
ncbi:MAG: terminase family protein [Gemmatimonadota bacterium]